MSDRERVDVGATAELAERKLQQVMVGRHTVALSCLDGEYIV